MLKERTRWKTLVLICDFDIDTPSDFLSSSACKVLCCFPRFLRYEITPYSGEGQQERPGAEQITPACRKNTQNAASVLSTQGAAVSLSLLDQQFWIFKVRAAVCGRSE